jgi:hypothetical protein
MLRAAVEQNGVVLLMTCNPTDTDLVYNACEGGKAGEGRQGHGIRHGVGRKEVCYESFSVVKLSSIQGTDATPRWTIPTPPVTSPFLHKMCTLRPHCLST